MSNSNKSNNNSGGKSSRSANTWKNEGKPFKGQCSEPEGNAIDISGNNVSQCNETVKVTLNHIGGEHRQGFCAKNLS